MSPARDNLDEVVEGVLEALAQVSADEAASFCLAQIEGLEAANAAALVGLVVGALALVCLAPFLEGDDRDEVAACFVRLVREQGDWQGVRWAPEILSPEALAALLVEAARDESTFFEAAPRLLAHLASRPPEVQALCLEPLFARFRALGPSERVALAYGASRWLAARSGGAFAERVASVLVANPGLLPAADGMA